MDYAMNKARAMRIAKITQALTWVFMMLLIGVILYMGLNIEDMIYRNSVIAKISDQHFPTKTSAEFQGWQVWLGWAFLSAPYAALFVTSIYFLKITKDFSKGDFFSVATASRFQILAAWIFITGFAKLVSSTGLVLAITANLGEGDRILVITATPGDVIAFFIGLIFLLLAQIFKAEKARVDEDDLIV